MAKEVKGFKSCKTFAAFAWLSSGSCIPVAHAQVINAATGMAIEILPKIAINCVRIMLIISAANSAICAVFEPLRCCTVAASAAAVIAGCLVATVKCNT